MDALITGILITASLLMVFTGITQFMYRIPVSLSAWVRSEDGSCCLEGTVGWGPMSIRVFPMDSGFLGEIRLFRRPLSQLPLKREENKPAPLPAPITEPKQNEWNISRYLHLAWGIFPKVIDHLSIGRFYGDITFGTGEPVTTGEMYGYYHAIRPFLDTDSFECSLKPDFHRLVCEGYVEGEILITRPLGLIIRAGAFLLPFYMSDRTTPVKILQGKNHA